MDSGDKSKEKEEEKKLQKGSSKVGAIPKPANHFHRPRASPRPEREKESSALSLGLFVLSGNRPANLKIQTLPDYQAFLTLTITPTTTPSLLILLRRAFTKLVESCLGVRSGFVDAVGGSFFFLIRIPLLLLAVRPFVFLRQPPAAPRKSREKRKQTFSFFFEAVLEWNQLTATTG